MTPLIVLAAALAGNLLPDGGFERWNDDASLPHGAAWRWRFSTPPGTNGLAVFERALDTRHGGEASLHLKDDVKGPYNHGISYRLHGDELMAVTGKVLRASAWIRQIASSSPDGVSVGISGKDAQGRRFGAWNSPGVIGETDWMNVQAKVRVPADVSDVRLVLSCAGGWGQTGEAYFDDVVLSCDCDDHPSPTVLDPVRRPEHAYEVRDADEPEEAAAARRAWRGQPPQEEDHRTRPEIRRGTWFVGDKPVFYLGVWLYCRDKEWRENANPLGITHPAYVIPPGKELFAGLGFNSSQISSAPAAAGAYQRGFPGDGRASPGEGKDWLRDEEGVTRFCRRFDDLPMVLDFAFGYDGRYPPEARRILDQRKAGTSWHRFVPFCPHHPEGARYYRDFFAGSARAVLRGGCNVFLYELFNESSWNDMCRYCAVDFAREMEGRYGSIEAANAVWGSCFDGFDDVAAQASHAQHPGVWYDWCVYSSRRYVELLEAGKSAVRSVDARGRIYFTEQASGTPPCHRGMDYRDIAASLDALALEGGWQYGFDADYRAADEMEAVVATAGSRHFFNCDFFQALAKGLKPVVNDEHYCLRIEKGKRVPSHRSDFITSLWLEVMHGVSANFTYVWDKRYWEAQTDEAARKNVETPSYKSSSLLNPHNVRPEDLSAFGDFRREMAPYEERLLPFPRVRPATVAVFYSKPSEIQRDRLSSRKSPVADWYCALLHAQFPVKVVFEEDLAALGPGVEALVFPGSQCNKREVAARARGFLSRGGVVVADERAFAYDEYLKPVAAEEGFVRAADASAAVRALLSRGVTRYAVLEPLDEAQSPIRAADVQICDRGSFKLVCLAAMGERAPRRARLKIKVDPDGLAYDATNVADGRRVANPGRADGR
ncbi:MAG: beta-galactosidase, partial [Kiritimatiellae bacterium]|nr:beta-galactosidase [Kiritimatiellia bacterium]